MKKVLWLHCSSILRSTLTLRIFTSVFYSFIFTTTYVISPKNTSLQNSRTEFKRILKALTWAVQKVRQEAILMRLSFKLKSPTKTRRKRRETLKRSKIFFFLRRTATWNQMARFLSGLYKKKALVNCHLKET